jgi:hypothetical protein
MRIKMKYYEKIKNGVIRKYKKDIKENGKRLKNGELLEDIASYVLKKLIVLHGLKATVQNDRKFNYSIKAGNFSKQVKLDVHLVPKGIKCANKSIISIESKAYPDSSMLERADWSSGHLKKGNPNTINIVLAFEIGASKESRGFFLNTGNIDKTFYILDGKRINYKPIWKDKFYKPINESKLIEFIEYVDSIIIDYMDNNSI